MNIIRLIMVVTVNIVLAVIIIAIFIVGITIIILLITVLAITLLVVLVTSSERRACWTNPALSITSLKPQASSTNF